MYDYKYRTKETMKRVIKKTIATILIATLLAGSLVIPYDKFMATESTEAIRLAKEIKRIKEERKEDAKNATVIKFDEDDKNALREDEEYIESLEDKLEDAKTGDDNEETIIDGILGVKKVEGAYIVRDYEYASAYIIKNLPVDKAIQKALIIDKYVYVIQRVNNDVFFSRYYKSTGLPTETETNKDSQYYGKSKFMLLQNFGHPQSLECYSYGNKYYFWICCGGKDFRESGATTGVYWSTEIARIEYQPGKSVKSSSCNRLIDVEKADTQGKGTGFGKIKRVDMALSSDGKNIVIWCRDTSGHDRFTYYSASKVNKALDEKTARSCDSTDLKKACVSYVNVKNTPGLVEQSFQGMELTNDDNMYIASAPREKTKKIVKISKKAKLIGSKTLTGSVLSPGQSEIEGLQIIGDYLYYGIVGLTGTYQRQQEQYIFKVAKREVM